MTGCRRNTISADRAGGSQLRRDSTELTPRQLLELGVFGGKYMTDCRGEFPASWFRRAKLSPERHDPSLNYFGVNASQPLSVWRRNGWIYRDDPRGWFQWYCRYYMGRRSLDDERQIRRWRQMTRHIAQIKQGCEPLDSTAAGVSARRSCIGRMTAERSESVSPCGGLDRIGCEMVVRSCKYQ